MKVLIACEESQTVCKAFRELGHEAYSCDIQFPSGGHEDWHICGDVLQVLNGGVFSTMNMELHEIPKWDLIIAHPPCTYLSNCATRSFSLKHTPADKVVKRWEERAQAAVFFMHFVYANCDRIAIENPVGFMNTAYRKADQIIHPYQFAKSTDDTENYVTKRTCLWLKGLKPLKTNNLPHPDNGALFGYHPNGNARTWEECVTGDRAKNRSKTFPAIAEQMAIQWGGKA